MKIGVIVFPGSNCDRDTHAALSGWYQNNYNLTIDTIWHKDQFDHKKYGFIILPGGFSYGDYLRAGAMACFSPVVKSLKQYIKSERPVLGICNGFQILCEMGFLSGALMKNEGLNHVAKDIYIKRINRDSIFTCSLPDRFLRLPVSHSDGAFYIDKDGKKELEDQNLIAFVYRENINGSVGNIAGILNERKNILGMMPHPERSVDLKGFCSIDGRFVFDSIFESLCG
jgi:phosphoribosylformylglycinamidine synthase